MRRESFRKLVLTAAAVSATPMVALAVESDGAAPYRPQGVRTPSGEVVRGEQYIRTASPFAPASALGGTSGTYVGPGNDLFFGLNPFATPSATWSVAGNWDPAVPNAGGTAYIGRPFQSGVEDQDSVSPTLDINVTLDNLIFDNELRVAVMPSVANNTITTAANGLRIENRSGLAVPFTGSFIFSEGARIYPQITGGGSVNIAGSGSSFPLPVTLASAANNFTGGLFVTNGGVAHLEEQPPGTDDPGVPYTGEAGLGNGTIVLNGGSIWLTSSAPSPTINVINKPIRLEAGGGTILTAGAQGVFANEFSGPGGLNLIFPTTKLFVGASTFTGDLRVGTGKVTLQQGGTMANAARAEVDGKLEIDNQVGGANRLGDTATVQINSAKYNVVGDPSADTDEKVGTISFSGYSTVTVQTQTGVRTTMSADNLVRNGKGTIFFRGENVGAASGEASLFKFTNAPAQIGGIVPFAIGATYGVGALPADEVVANNVQIGRATLVRYDTTRGIVPLDLATDYSLNFAGAGPASNVKVDTASTFTGTINALVMGNPANDATGVGAVLSGGQINIASGALLNNSNGSVINNPITTSAPELFIHSTSATAGTDVAGGNGLRLAGVISGNIDVTRSGHGNVYFFANNTYTGQTTLIGGRAVINANVLPNQPGPFGQAPQTTPIRFVAASTGPEAVAGIDTTRLFTINNITIGRDMIIEGTGVGGVQIGAIAPSTLTLAGNISVTTTDDVVLSGNIDITGNLSGTGNLTDVPGLQLRLSGNNGGWSGGFEFQGTSTDANPTTVRLASANAFGTGEIFLSGPSRIIAEGGPRTMTNRMVMDPSDAGYILLDGSLTTTGNVVGASFTRTFLIPSTGDVNFAGSFENSGYIFKGVGTLASATLGTGGGTVTLSGNNNHNGRLFVGGFATTVGGQAPVWVKLASNNALGQAGIEMQALNSVIELTGGINMPDRNIFIKGLGNGAGALQSSGGNNVMAGNIILVNDSTLTVGTGLGGIGVAAGTTLTVTNDLIDITGDPAATPTPIPDGGTFRKLGAGTLVLPRVVDAETQPNGSVIARNLTGFDVQAGVAQVSVGTTNNATDKVSRIVNLTVNTGAGAKLDLTNNALIVDYSGPSQRATVEALITSGRSAGTWTGAGIVSSSANAGQFALGVGEITDTPFSGTFLGQTVDADAVVVRFTRYGDANLDGVTNIADFSRLAANFNSAGRWATGDFNYDQQVSIGDFSLLAANFNLTAIDAPGRPGAVPEPAAMGALALAAAGLLGRRRRA